MFGAEAMIFSKFRRPSLTDVVTKMIEQLSETYKIPILNAMNRRDHREGSESAQDDRRPRSKGESLGRLRGRDRNWNTRPTLEWSRQTRPLWG